MGHTRLGRIPKSRKWNAVVASLSEATDPASSAPALLADEISLISSQALDAAEEGIKGAIEDEGLRFTFYLLTQLVLSAREDNWITQLADTGMALPPQPTVFDLTTSFQNAIDDHLFEKSAVTDISEIAQKAASDALAKVATSQTGSLFGEDETTLQSAVHTLSTKKGFSELGQSFFGHFMARFLNFYLSRITATYAGTSSLPQVGDITKFNENLHIHCHQSAHVVHDFCGEWYSKTEWKQGIDFNNASGFVAVAVKKLQRELQQQKESDD